MAPRQLREETDGSLIPILAVLSAAGSSPSNGGKKLEKIGCALILRLCCPPG